MSMNREILRIAIPNIISNITVPLMGIASTAIAGRWDTADSASTIGALAIGVSIFNFIYWNCGFVRMGTSGLTAQAYGAKDWQECTHMLARSLVVSVALGALVLLLQVPLGELSLWAMNGSEVVEAYYYARIWAVPAGILLFGLNGWYTGMQNAVIPMVIAIIVNVVHILCSVWFVFGYDLGIVGIAYASVVGQLTGVILSLVGLVLFYRKLLRRIIWREVFDAGAMQRFFRINRDIMLRTLCIVAVYTFFTAISARMEEGLLAVNTLLLQLFTLFSYMNDGFAYAAEALTGRFIGARDEGSLRRCLVRCLAWGTLISVIFVGVYVVGWRDLLGLFVSRESADAGRILELAGHYIGWIIVIPLAAAMPFIMDGIMVGATRTRTMRNSMFFSTVAYFVIFFSLQPLIGNNALWLAFTAYMFLRGVLQYLMTDRLKEIYGQASAPIRS
uniref:MATE family efflux transporter n=1 Tax=Alistipes sp. TaxID=1872444 RepID=UPI004055A257